MSLDVVILAAGKGTRMFSSTPKVLHPLGGRPLLQHVVQTARELSANGIVVVYGYGGEQVPSAFADNHLRFVRQEPQLGTGHAVQQALPNVTGEHTLVLYGDVPLTRPETLAQALQERNGLTLITADLDDPTGYGRIVRDRAGRVVRIVEERDASPAEKSIREINTGILAAPTAKLRAWLEDLRDDNAQGEYYLTDIIARAVADGVTIHTVRPRDTWEILGVNSKEQLAELERIYQRGQAMKLMTAGVSLADPARIDVRGELICGPDVSIDVNCVFEGKVALEAGVSVGANCVIKDTVVEAGARILPFCH
ncbi:MAG TPA: bifunctional UDP-N-acetylglucosamine diphosphorylase/glucosamine-1-phosphate N-acetyltransferase GlmU, partial [Burkholderiales bacterium]|nr:bifunctional UDP-N-acetylglucosamine diphosphorylase/glucosamine-1-phosphate N-acetyltransferase GlmU [Burkholderiales bacterium]